MSDTDDDPRAFVDTNVVVYMHDAEEPAKQKTARSC